MKLIAAAGKVSVQAQSDNVEVIANKVLELLSETDWVNIRGKKGVRLHGTNNMVEIGETVQFFTSAPVLFHGNLETLPAKSVSQAFNERSHDYHFDQEVNFVDMHLKGVQNVAYELVRDDGTVIDGKTATTGSTGMQKSGGFDSYTIRYKGELP
jgi:type VI secretion system secreted protein VgrG